MPHPFNPASLQATAVAVSSSDLTSYIVPALLVIAIAFQTWLVNMTQETRRIVRAIEQSVFGRTGDNGLEGTVHLHAEHIGDLQRRVDRHDGLFDRIDDERRKGPSDRRHE